MIWYLIRVQAGRERIIRDELHTLGHRALVPVRIDTRRIRGRTAHVPRPLMPAYVAAGFVDPPWFDLARIRGWYGPVRIGDRLATLSPSEVAAVELMSVSRPLQLAASRVSPGDIIRIKRGAYAELAALVQRLDGAGVVVTVDMFGKAHTLTIDEALVEAA